MDNIVFKRILEVRSAEWLSFTDLALHCGMGGTAMRELTKRPDFPRPSEPTGKTKLRRWRKSKVDEWMAAHELEPVGES